MAYIYRKKKYLNFEWLDFQDPDIRNLETISIKNNLDIYHIKDSLEEGHLPKYEKLQNYNFLIIRGITSKMGKRFSKIAQFSNKIAVFYNDNKLITIHREAFDFIEKIENSFTNVNDFLTFIIHKILNTYKLPIIDLEKKIDGYEELLFTKDHINLSIKEMYIIKTQARKIKKLLNMTQNSIFQINFNTENNVEFQDIKDQLNHLILNYDEIYENTINLMNSYHSINSQKTNEVMKMLTIFSAFFLPLSFIVGLYGMNFYNMPELKTKYGYFIILGIILSISILLFLWFRRKKYL